MKNVKNVVLATVLGSAFAFAGSAAFANDFIGSTVTTESASSRDVQVEVMADGTVKRTAVVSYRDLNLDQKQDLETLYARIKKASNRVCGKKLSAGQMNNDWSVCYKDAVDGAISQINDIGLVNYHHARSGRLVSNESQVARAN